LIVSSILTVQARPFARDLTCVAAGLVVASFQQQIVKFGPVAPMAARYVASPTVKANRKRRVTLIAVLHSRCQHQSLYCSILLTCALGNVHIESV
jgi:hypothetical protein